MVLTQQNISAALAARPELNRLDSARVSKDPSQFKTMLTSQLGVSQEVYRGKDVQRQAAQRQNPLAAQTPGPAQTAQPLPTAPADASGTGLLAAVAARSAARTEAREREQQARQAPRQAPNQAPRGQTEVRGRLDTPEVVVALTQPGQSGHARPESGAGAETAPAATSRQLSGKPASEAATRGPAHSQAGADPRAAAPGQDRQASATARTAATQASPGSRGAENRPPVTDDLGHLPGGGARTPLPQGFTKEEETLLFAAAASESKFLAAKRRAAKAQAQEQAGPGEKIGVLSAVYESRGAIDAIGYDGRGGTSYGLYQIASGVGTMNRFLDYLENKAPDIAKRLNASGPSNTGGRHGAMAEEWKRISQENPKRFESLQHEFIRETHYTPALKSITLSVGEDISKRSQAVREVLWSTAVQHGPNGATDIFTGALEKLQPKGQAASDKALIEEVYSRRMESFAGRGRLRDAVTNRLEDEKGNALAMLGGKIVS